MIYAASVTQDVKPESPWLWVVIGLVVAAIGGAVMPLGIAPVTVIGIVVLAAGSALTAVGVIGVGVEMGMARHTWRQRR